MDGIVKITGLSEIERPLLDPTGKRDGVDFADSLKEAIVSVDDLQKESEAAQQAYAVGEEVDLHDVLIKIEEAEIAFKAMMAIRNKLVEAYQEVMRMGS